MIDQTELKKYLSYDKETGHFTWIKVASNMVKVGSRAGFLDARGYWTINVLKERSTGHRVAWIYEHGSIPEGMQIDHINGNRSDNRLVNLRVVTRSENQQNRRSANKGTKTGFLGVHKHFDKFRSKIYANGKAKHLGLFDTAELAYNAYVSAKRKLHLTCTI